jgi:capsid protein
MISPFKFLGYDAISARGRRRAPQTRIKHEDLILKNGDRKKLVATAQDVQRNFAIAAWMIRKHLDYVATFRFQSKLGIDFDDEVESYMARWGSRHNCDLRRQHPFRRIVRMAEARRIVDGDFFLLKMSGDGVTRGKLQAIESDRVETPKDPPPGFRPEDWKNGVRTTVGGTPQEYCINRRDDYGNLSFERFVPADSLFVHGWYDRFDQVRGISPIAAALNTLQDTYEGFDMAFAKLKVSQLFALAFYREADVGFDATTATLDKDDDGIADSGYEVDFGAGPVQLDLNPGDKAEFLESKSPAAETVAFLEMMIQVALKSLDLPYSFYDEAHTNFFGSKGSLQNYRKSCEAKQADLIELLDEITSWRLGMAIFDGDLVLPGGIDFTDLVWEWVPAGVQWWDPAKEVRGYTMAIAAGLDNPQRICRETGTDFFENVDAIAEAIEYAKSRGVNLQMATTGTSSMDEVQNQSEDEQI